MGEPDTPPFTDEILNEISQPIFEGIMDQPMISGLGEGTLSESKFKTWLKQDYVYLVDDGRTYAIAGAEIDSTSLQSLHWMSNFLESAHSCVSSDRKGHVKFAGKLGISLAQLQSTAPRPTTEAYRNYLVRTASTRPFGEVVAATLPCYCWYYRIATRLGSSPNPIYQEWIDHNSGKSYKKDIESMKSIMDEIAADASFEERTQYVQRFLVGASYEYMFWDACYSDQQWPVCSPFVDSKQFCGPADIDDLLSD